MHFRYISAKIQPKNLDLVHYLFLAVRGNISIGGEKGALAMPLQGRILSFVGFLLPQSPP